jgi:hypothetical protein
MNFKNVAIPAFLVMSLSGCQTVSQSATPALYELRSNILNHVRTYCVSAGNKSTKANHTQFSGAIKIGAGENSNWVKARIRDSVNYLEGMAYYDASTRRTYCGGVSWSPANAPYIWRDINESDALRLLGR